MDTDDLSRHQCQRAMTDVIYLPCALSWEFHAHSVTQQRNSQKIAYINCLDAVLEMVNGWDAIKRMENVIGSKAEEEMGVTDSSTSWEATVCIGESSGGHMHTLTRNQHFHIIP